MARNLLIFLSGCLASGGFAMKWTVLIALIAALYGLVAFGGAPPALAAACDPRLELDRAADLLDRARDIVERSEIREARELLRAASTRFSEAKERLRANRPGDACLLARAAQQLALRAVDMAQNGRAGVGEIERILARTREVLQDAASGAADSDVPAASRLIELAFDQQRQADTAFRAGRYRLALKLTLLARTTADRARRLAEGRPIEDRRDVERNLAETDRLLDEAGRVIGSEGAEAPRVLAEILDRAVEMQAQAWRQLRAGRPGLALQFTQQARLLATRALDRVDVEIDRSEIEPLLASTGELLDRLGETVRDGGDSSLREHLVRARRLLDDARASLDAGRARDALGSVRAASVLALQVSERLASGGGD